MTHQGQELVNSEQGGVQEKGLSQLIQPLPTRSIPLFLSPVFQGKENFKTNLIYQASHLEKWRHVTVPIH